MGVRFATRYSSDIQYKQPMYSHAASIYGRNILFDYATQYHMHKQIEQPDLFQATDREIDDFYEYLKEINFSYQSQAVPNTRNL